MDANTDLSVFTEKETELLIHVCKEKCLELRNNPEYIKTTHMIQEIMVKLGKRYMNLVFDEE